MLAASGLMGLSLMGLNLLNGGWPAWLTCVVGIGLGAFVYGTVTLVAGAEEPRAVLTWVKGRLVS